MSTNKYWLPRPGLKGHCGLPRLSGDAPPCPCPVGTPRQPPGRPGQWGGGEVEAPSLPLQDPPGTLDQAQPRQQRLPHPTRGRVPLFMHFLLCSFMPSKGCLLQCLQRFCVFWSGEGIRMSCAVKSQVPGWRPPATPTETSQGTCGSKGSETEQTQCVWGTGKKAEWLKDLSPSLEENKTR